MSRQSPKFRTLITALFAALLPLSLAAETCTTPSQMSPADNAALNTAALSFAAKVRSGDASGIRTLTIPQYSQNFAAIAAAITTTAPQIAADTLAVTTLYILDASKNTATQDTQFFCSLSNSAEVIISLPALPPGRYALATLRATGSASATLVNAWQLTFILQQLAGKWELAGFIPRPASAAGHDGLWYWTQARQFTRNKQPWNAWLYYTQADALLTPVDFLTSTNRDKLHAEQTAAQPPQIAVAGISADHPLAVSTFAFTAIGTQPSQDGKALDLALHVTATDVSDPAAVRVRSLQALEALLAAYPELRSAFPGAWVYADAPGQSPFAIEFNPIPAAP